jgi:hypothetical protein
MNQTELKKKRDELQVKYDRMMEAHTKRSHISNEGAYMDSANAVKAVYEELGEVSNELGTPIPIWF